MRLSNPLPLNTLLYKWGNQGLESQRNLFSKPFWVLRFINSAPCWPLGSPQALCPWLRPEDGGLKPAKTWGILCAPCETNPGFCLMVPFGWLWKLHSLMVTLAASVHLCPPWGLCTM